MSDLYIMTYNSFVRPRASETPASKDKTGIERRVFRIVELYVAWAMLRIPCFEDAHTIHVGFSAATRTHSGGSHPSLISLDPNSRLEATVSPV